jgi:hypothetical protein
VRADRQRVGFLRCYVDLGTRIVGIGLS